MKNKEELVELTDEQLKEVTGGTGNILDEIQEKKVEVATAGTESLDRKAIGIIEQAKIKVIDAAK